MAQNEQIILDVKFNGEGAAQSLARLQAELQALKDKQAEANKAIKAGNQLTEEQAADYAVTAQRIVEAKTAISAASSAIREANKSTQANNGSIASMRQELSHLTKQYDSLSAEQRNNADIGGALKSRINELTDELKGLESATGRNQRNVGNYTQSILEATKGMGGLGKGVQGAVQPFSNLNNGMKAMAANPWMAIISLAVTIVLKLTEAFKKNGAAMESLNKVFGIFSGIGVIVDKVIDNIASGVSKFADRLISLGQRLGIINEEMQKGVDIAQEQLALAQQSREVRMEEADAAAEIAKLRETAGDKENFSLKERIDALKEAQEKEDAIAKKRIAIAEREYLLAKEISDQANSSQEELDKTADAYVKWQNAIAETANASRALDRQLNAMNAEAAREAEQRRKEQAQRAKEAREKRLQELQEQAKNELDIIRQLELSRINEIKDEHSKEIALALLANQQEIDALYIKLNTIKEAEVTARAEIQELIEAKEREKLRAVEAINKKYEDAEKSRTAALQDEIGQMKLDKLEVWSTAWLDASLAKLEQQYEAELAAAENNEEQKTLITEKYALKREQINQQHSDALTQKEKEANEFLTESRRKVYENSKEFVFNLGEASAAFIKDEKKRAKVQKGLALGQIAVKEGELIASTASAIGSAVDGASKAASSGGPLAPILLAAFTAEMVATVLGALAGTAANIAQAKNLVSGGAFAEGGIVGGSSYQGDRVITRTNSGEMILTKSQQAQLFSIANGGQTASLNYEAMGAMMREAFASAPAPVMDYSEFTQFQKNVANYKEIASL